MKKALSYLVLLAYGTSMLMPLLPYLSDKVAHTFWLYQHISTVHYEHGQYHSHYEAAAVAKKTNTEKGSAVAKYANNADEHFVTNNSFHFHLPITTNQIFTSYSLTAITANLFTDFPPPKA